eukprot:4091935-Prymnesium_polylepis.1
MPRFLTLGVLNAGPRVYGDPLDPNGDLAAMRELRMALLVGGLLLLGVPTAVEDDVACAASRPHTA